MSKLLDLIEELCPKGVPFKKISEIASVERGKRVVREQLPASGKYLVYQNSLTPLGFIDEFNYPANTTFVIGAGAAGEIGYSRDDFWAADDCFPVVCNDSLDSKYMYHFLLSRQSTILANVRRGSIPRLSRQVIETLSIPVPPIAVQLEIVHILDLFIELDNELNRELDKRNLQFEGCSRMLFNSIRSTAPRFELWKLCNVTKGVSPIQKTNPGQYPMVVTTAERKTSDEYQFDAKAVCIPLVSSRGHGVASLNHVYYQEGKFALGNILCALVPLDESKLIAKYLYYYFEETKDYSLVPLIKGGANVSLRIDDIVKVSVPVPPIEVQEKIIHSLEHFEELCYSKKSGIPAEIEARQKQYEYYRDQLFTFTEIQ